MLTFGFREQPIDYGDLEDSIRKTCLKLGLEDVDGFVTKCIQLYETTVVRHGLMLVGPTGSGKTRVSVCLLHKGTVKLAHVWRTLPPAKEKRRGEGAATRRLR